MSCNFAVDVVLAYLIDKKNRNQFGKQASEHREICYTLVTNQRFSRKQQEMT